MIELRNVTKVFNLTGNEADKRVALDHVNLKIDDGEFVTIIGSNGSGKSTTLNIITGSLFPDEGSVVLSGMDITNMKEHQRAKYFGRVFQDPMMGTTAEMSCLENLEIAYRRGKNHSPIKWGFSNNIVKLYYKQLLSEFSLGLEDRLGQKVGVMSGGQRQALTLLMAATDARLDTKKEFVKMYLDIHTGELRNKKTDEIYFYKNASNSLKGQFEGEKVRLIQSMNYDNSSEVKSTIRQMKISLKKELIKLKEELLKQLKGIELEIEKVKTEGKKIAEDFYLNKEKEYKDALENAQNDEEKLNAYIAFSNSLHEFNLDRKILLLDEHTAALDPKTAKKVLDLTDKIVREKKLTTIMITHNMKDAITYGDRLIMFHGGHIIYDVSGKEKENLTVEKLLKMFNDADVLAELN